MIDLHTHTLLSDGELLPSELVRYALQKGYSVIGLTDHVDASNIDFVLSATLRVAKNLNKYWRIKVVAGVEITHMPLEEIKKMTRYARKSGAKLIVVHGETISEPVLEGTNLMAVEAGVDILAHPGYIDAKVLKIAHKRKVYIEITTRKNHLMTNRFVISQCLRYGGRLLLNTDAHTSRELIATSEAMSFLSKYRLKKSYILQVLKNSQIFLKEKNI